MSLQTHSGNDPHPVPWGLTKGDNMTDSIFNGHDLEAYLKTPYITVDSHWFSLRWFDDGGRRVNHVYRLRTGPSLHADKSNEKITYGTWTESVEVAQRRFNIDPNSWVPVLGNKGSGVWIPLAAAERAKSQKLCWGGNSKSRIKFGEPGRPCTLVVTGDRGWSGHACGRPVVAEEESRGIGAEDGVEYRCKLHQAASERAAANAAERREKSEARDEERRRKNANRERCEEVLEKIRPLLGELGIHPDTLDVGEAWGGKVGILPPAEVAELLTSKAIELEEIMGGDF